MTLNVGIHSGSGSACTRDRTEIVMVWCRAVGRSENPGVPVNLVGLICPHPGWDRVNWFAKIWGCHGTPGTPGDDRPAVVCGQKIDCFHLGPEPEQPYHSKQSKQWLHRRRWCGVGSGCGGGGGGGRGCSWKMSLRSSLFSSLWIMVLASTYSLGPSPTRLQRLHRKGRGPEGHCVFNCILLGHF